MANLATSIFRTNGNFTAPAGVTKVTVQAFKKVENGPVFVYNGGVGSLIDSFGRLFRWGQNAQATLGNGNQVDQSSPVAVLGGLTFSSVRFGSGGSDFSLGLTPTGLAYGWGRNANGNLGVGDVIPRSSPVAVVGGLTFQKIYIAPFSGGNNAYSLALTPAGKAYAWGMNALGQLGVGDTTPRSSPVAVVGALLFQELSIAVNNVVTSSVMGIRLDNKALYAWGRNSAGELGVGDVTDRSSPTPVLGGLAFQKVIAVQGTLGASWLALTTTGVAYAWGDNTNGQLGVGDVTPRSSPVAVLGGLKFISIFRGGGDAAFYGLTASGALYAWGNNTKGGLGVGDNTPRSSPVAVLGGHLFERVFIGTGNGNVAFGVDKTGITYAWGENVSGELGVGDVISRSSPVAVLGGLNFVQICAADFQSVVGVDASGVAYGWGLNANGQLGLGDVTPRSSPVAVVGGLLGNMQDQVTQTTLPVIPGTTYAVNMGQYVATFGNFPIGSGAVDVVAVSYAQ